MRLRERRRRSERVLTKIGNWTERYGAAEDAAGVEKTLHRLGLVAAAVGGSVLFQLCRGAIDEVGAYGEARSLAFEWVKATRRQLPRLAFSGKIREAFESLPEQIAAETNSTLHPPSKKEERNLAKSVLKRFIKAVEHLDDQRLREACELLATELWGVCRNRVEALQQTQFTMEYLARYVAPTVDAIRQVAADMISRSRAAGLAKWAPQTRDYEGIGREFVQVFMGDFLYGVPLGDGRWSPSVLQLHAREYLGPMRQPSLNTPLGPGEDIADEDDASSLVADRDTRETSAANEILLLSLGEALTGRLKRRRRAKATPTTRISLEDVRDCVLAFCRDWVRTNPRELIPLVRPRKTDIEFSKEGLDFLRGYFGYEGNRPGWIMKRFGVDEVSFLRRHGLFPPTGTRDETLAQLGKMEDEAWSVFGKRENGSADDPVARSSRYRLPPRPRMLQTMLGYASCVRWWLDNPAADPETHLVTVTDGNLKTPTPSEDLWEYLYAKFGKHRKGTLRKHLARLFAAMREWARRRKGRV